MLLADFFYNGTARWQFGFDNPNKAAVFAVELALAGMALMVSARRFVRFLGVALVGSSLYALLHTFSRGGVVAFAVSSIPLAVVGLRRMKCVRAVVRASLWMAVAGFVLLSVQVGLVGRLAHGFLGKDRSVGNRIDLWRTTPQMLCDAPFGWGLGKSGEAYMQWYQPLDRSERYRTLVNSHLTWIVETGVVGGAVWCGLWGTVLAFGFLVGRRHGEWLCWSEWAAFFVAALFSSVCESYVLWVIPVAVLGWTFAARGRHPFMCALRWGLCCVIGFGCVAGASIGWLRKKESGIIRKCDYGIRVGHNRPLFWLVPDQIVLGGEMYPREIRETLCGRDDVSFAIVRHARQIPKNAEVVVVCGAADNAGRRGWRKTIWLSPTRIDMKLDNKQLLVVGGLSAVSGLYGDQVGVTVVEGADEYIPEWLPLLLDLAT